MYANIAFTGRFASGKTYFSNLLLHELENKGIIAYKVSISQKIKDIASDLFGMKIKNRRLLQEIAGKMREIDEDVWINYLINSIKTNKKEPFVIDDVRFVREVNLLRQNFSRLVVIKLQTKDVDRIAKYQELYDRAPTSEEINDPTENDVDNIKADIVYENNYNSDEAKMQINQLINTYFI
ncbi:MAG: hypothetical protein QXD11_01055 [Candidatus Micrarchaeaceae archaeon]